MIKTANEKFIEAVRAVGAELMRGRFLEMKLLIMDSEFLIRVRWRPESLLLILR